MDQEKIEFALALNLANFRRAATVAVGHVQSMSNDIKKHVGGSTADFKLLKKSVLAIGTAATAVTVGGLWALKRGLTEVTALSGIQEDAEIRLAGVIRATGSAAGYTLQELRGMAADLQGVTRAGDETTLSGMAILTTFKNIKRDGGVFEETTKAALNMSTVMGQDLKPSMIQLGKAINDPITGMSALSRVGVTFTQQQKDQIKAMQQSGNLMGAQKIILEELRSEFGATAEAMRGNFKGGQIAISNAFGDMKEEAGFAITKNKFFLESQKLVEKSINELTGKMSANGQEMRDMAKNIALSVIDGAALSVEALRFIYNGYQGLKLAAHGAVVALVKGAELTAKALRVILKPLDLLLTGLEKIGVIDKNPLASLEKSLNGFGKVSIEEFNKLYSVIEKKNAVFDGVKDKINGLKKTLSSYSTERVDAAENVQEKADKKNSREVAPRQYGGSKPQFQMINGQYVMTQQAQKTSAAASPTAESKPDKVVEIQLGGGRLRGSEDSANAVINALQQAGLSA